MDYLDPKKKKAHKIRLLVGYALFGVAIGLATLLLVFIANGYYVDRNTGQVIQNGLVFVDSNPGGAQIYINGELQRGTTDARIVIPGDQEYTIELKKDGYRDWSRFLRLEGGSLRELTYARLMPNEIEQLTSVNLPANPVNASQSIDKRWIILSYAENPLQLSLVDLEATPVSLQTIQIPESLFANPLVGTFEVEEWADDNRFLLASYTVGNSKEYIRVDITEPESTINLSTLFQSKVFDVQLQDRKRDRFFVYNRDSQIMYTATLNGGVNTTPYLNKKIIAYENFGNDWTTYITESGKEGLVQARFKRGDQDILLKEIKTDDSYFVELAKLGDEPIMAISSPSENKATVYRDPQKYLRENPEARLPVATTVLRVVKPQDVIISSDSSVIMAYGPENMASHEFEADRSYNFKIEVNLDDGQEPRWIDGQHFSFSSGGVQYSLDFDGSNVYDLLPSISRLGSFYTDSVEEMITFNPAEQNAEGVVTQAPRLVISSLLTPEDR